MSKKTDFEDMDKVLTNAFRLMVIIVTFLFLIGGIMIMSFKKSEKPEYLNNQNIESFEQNPQELHQSK